MKLSGTHQIVDETHVRYVPTIKSINKIYNKYKLSLSRILNKLLTNIV